MLFVAQIKADDGSCQFRFVQDPGEVTPMLSASSTVDFRCIKLNLDSDHKVAELVYEELAARGAGAAKLP